MQSARFCNNSSWSDISQLRLVCHAAIAYSNIYLIFSCMCLSVDADKSQSEAADGVKQATASATDVDVGESDENFDQRVLLSTNVTHKTDDLDVSESHQAAAETVAGKQRETGQKHRRKSHVRAAPVKQWLNEDAINNVAAAATARQTDDRHTVLDLAWSESDNRPANVTDQHRQPVNHKHVISPAVYDVLEIIDDTGVTVQHAEECHADVKTDKARSKDVDLNKSDTLLVSKPPRKAVVVSRSDISLRYSGKHVELADSDTESETPLVNLSTALQSPPQLDRATACVTRSLHKAHSSSAKKHMSGRRMQQTRFATPGRAGNLACNTTRRAGKMVLTSPGRAGNLAHNTPRRAAKAVLTSPGFASNVACKTPRRAGKKQTSTTEHPGGTTGEVCSTPRLLRGSTVTSGGDDGGVSVLSPASAKLFSSPAAALKRNAKGETALHSAAIKVLIIA